LRAIVAKVQSEAKRKQSHEKPVVLEIAKPVPRPARNLAPRNDGERILDYLGNYLPNLRLPKLNDSMGIQDELEDNSLISPENPSGHEFTFNFSDLTVGT